MDYLHHESTHWKVFGTPQGIADGFSHDFKTLASGPNPVHIALSGGSTPKLVFDTLAEKYADTIPWETVRLYWGDERAVPPDDPESNYRMAKEHLLSKIPIPEANIFRIRGEEDPHVEAKRYADVLDAELPREMGAPRFDLIILGMGEDGHTASLFPTEGGLWEFPRNCTVGTHPETGQKRITITGRVIDNAKQVAFLVTGAAKAEKVAQIHYGTGNYRSYPASLVSPVNGELTWYLDTDAAKGISPIGA